MFLICFVLTETDQNFTLIYNIELVKIGHMAGFSSYCQLQENDGEQRGMFPESSRTPVSSSSYSTLKDKLNRRNYLVMGDKR